MPASASELLRAMFSALTIDQPPPVRCEVKVIVIQATAVDRQPVIANDCARSDTSSMDI